MDYLTVDPGTPGAPTNNSDPNGSSNGSADVSTDPVAAENKTNYDSNENSAMSGNEQGPVNSGCGNNEESDPIEQPDDTSDPYKYDRRPSPRRENKCNDRHTTQLDVVGGSVTVAEGKCRCHCHCHQKEKTDDQPDPEHVDPCDNDRNDDNHTPYQDLDPGDPEEQDKPEEHKCEDDESRPDEKSVIHHHYHHCRCHCHCNCAKDKEDEWSKDEHNKDCSCRRHKTPLPVNEAGGKYCKDVHVIDRGSFATDKRDRVGVLRAVLTKTDKLWQGDNIVIKYSYASGKLGGDPIQQKKVDDTIIEWTWYANVTFERVDSDADVRVQFDSSPSEGSWSLVGTDSLASYAEGNVTMNLGWVKKSPTTATMGEKAVILHEWGHVLGMLHEHQSLAGGGVPLRYEEAAIKYYGDTQGWDAEDVREQVINTYNTKDVSSFSQVDRFSIMQYPMPASVTGLAYDIDYNYYLSPLDKAYMCIMYPRPNQMAHPSQPDWTFTYALEKSGVTREDPTVTKKLQAAYVAGQNADKTTIDSTEVRNIFSAWCRKAHETTSVDPQRDVQDPQKNKTADPDSVVAQKSVSDGDRIVTVPPLKMCSTDEMKGQSTQSAPSRTAAPQSSHAVIDTSDEWLFRIATTERSEAYLKKVYWAVAFLPDQYESGKQSVKKTGAYQGEKTKRYRSDLVEWAVSQWEKSASVIFYKVPLEEAKVVIVFQDFHPTTAEPIDRFDPNLRSYCLPKLRTPGSDPKDAALPKIEHKICYRGLSKDESQASQETSIQTITGEGNEQVMYGKDWDRRSVMHELGHLLGLDHEEAGAYGYWIYDQPQEPNRVAAETELRKLQAKYATTVLDTGSIMDALRGPEAFDKFKGVSGKPLGIRTVCNLSKIDRANIALLHPGARLVWPKSGPDLLESSMSALQLLESTKVTLRDLAAQCNWYQFRQAYLTALKTQSEEFMRNLDMLSDYIESSVTEAKKSATINPDLPGVVVGTPANMCSTIDTTDTSDSSKSTIEKKAAHAVVDPAVLEEFFIPDGNQDFVSEIRWKLIFYPAGAYSDAAYQDDASVTFRRALLQEAFKTWERYASIKFTETATVEASSMLIVFQDFVGGERIQKSDSTLRSYAQGSTRVPDPTNPLIPSAPPFAHRVCFRGISKSEDEAANRVGYEVLTKNGSRMQVTNRDWDRRTLIHEIGHVLGLKHENVGVYGYQMFGQGIKAKNPAGNIQGWEESFRSTIYDTGSVMDSMITPDVLEKMNEMGGRLTRVRTVLEPSEIDAANIALLYPGQHLEGSEGAKLLAHYFQVLQLPSPERTLPPFLQLAADRRWSNIRSGYLKLLDYQMKQALKDKTAIIDQLQLKDGDKPAKSIDPKKALDPKNALDPKKARDNAPPPEPPAAASKGLLDLIYEQLMKTIGPTGPQILSLQFPTRYLAKEEFQFELTGIYSNFTKPTVVAEAEFRFTDALYDAAAIVSAPNGRSLSTVYNQMINNFVPKYSEADRKVRQERERIRSWLLTEVGSQDPYYKYDFNTAGGGKGDNEETLKKLNSSLTTKNSFVRKMSRMEFASQLTQDYYEAQMKWELERDEMVSDAIASNDPVKLSAVTRKLVHISQSEQGKLAMKNADSVVRGYSHIVREALGHLDVATPAELLQDAKDAFRTTAISSLFGASKVYPVLMSPVDWSNALDTGFAPEDLAENPELLIIMIKTRASALDTQKSQLALLQSSTQGDPATLKAEVDGAALALENAESALHAKYLDSTIELAKISVAIASGGVSAVVETAVEDTGLKDSIAAGKKSKEDVDEELESSASLLDPLGTVEDVTRQVQAVNVAQRNLQSATSAWNSKKGALTRAQVTSTKTDQAFIEASIATLTAELVDLRARLTMAEQSKQQRINLAKDGQQLTVGGLATMKPPPGGGGSRWQEINIVSDQEYSNQSTSLESKTISERWNVNFWIGSAGGSNEKSDASFLAESNSGKIHLEIAMKVTLVTVDRSSWFQPQLFDNTPSYMRNTSSMVFNKYPDGSGPNATPDSVAEKFRKTAHPTALPNSTLSAYPVGYIICKDVFIKCSNMNLASREQKTQLLEKSQSSGGFLCFSYNRASEHTKDTSSASFTLASDGMIVRIPGPQILGYVQQIVPQDISIPYDPAQSLGKEFYLPPPADPALSENTIKPAHSVQPNGDGPPPQYAADPPMFDVRPTNMSAAERAARTTTSTTTSSSSAAARGAEPQAAPPAATQTSATTAPAKANSVPPTTTTTTSTSSDEEETLVSHLLHALRSDEGFKQALKKDLNLCT